MKYPIDVKNNQFAYGFWLGRMLGLLQASLSISSRELDSAKEVFSSGFGNLFPEGDNNLNSLKIQDFIINLDQQTEDQIWSSYSRLLQLWMDLQEETLPGVDESEIVSEQHFVNVLRLSERNLEQLQK